MWRAKPLVWVDKECGWHMDRKQRNHFRHSRTCSKWLFKGPLWGYSFSFSSLWPFCVVLEDSPPLSVWVSNVQPSAAITHWPPAEMESRGDLRCCVWMFVWGHLLKWKDWLPVSEKGEKMWPWEFVCCMNLLAVWGLVAPLNKRTR